MVPWIAETCGRCGRPLKTDKSREVGYVNMANIEKPAAIYMDHRVWFFYRG